MCIKILVQKRSLKFRKERYRYTFDGKDGELRGELGYLTLPRGMG